MVSNTFTFVLSNNHALSLHQLRPQLFSLIFFAMIIKIPLFIVNPIVITVNGAVRRFKQCHIVRQWLQNYGNMLNNLFRQWNTIVFPLLLSLTCNFNANFPHLYFIDLHSMPPVDYYPIVVAVERSINRLIYFVMLCCCCCCYHLVDSPTGGVDFGVF